MTNPTVWLWGGIFFPLWRQIAAPYSHQVLDMTKSDVQFMTVQKCLPWDYCWSQTLHLKTDWDWVTAMENISANTWMTSGAEEAPISTSLPRLAFWRPEQIFSKFIGLWKDHTHSHKQTWGPKVIPIKGQGISISGWQSVTEHASNIIL